MKPIVLVHMDTLKKFFVFDEDATAEGLIQALKEMTNGNVILYDLFMIQMTERLPPQRKEVDYAQQSP